VSTFVTSTVKFELAGLRDSVALFAACLYANKFLSRAAAHPSKVEGEDGSTDKLHAVGSVLAGVKHQLKKSLISCTNSTLVCIRL